MTDKNFIKTVCDNGVHCYACRTNEFIRLGFEEIFGSFECPKELPLGWKPEGQRVFCPYYIQTFRLSNMKDCEAVSIECFPPEWAEPGRVSGKTCPQCKHNLLNEEKDKNG